MHARARLIAQELPLGCVRLGPRQEAYEVLEYGAQAEAVCDTVAAFEVPAGVVPAATLRDWQVGYASICDALACVKARRLPLESPSTHQSTRGHVHEDSRWLAAASSHARDSAREACGCEALRPRGPVASLVAAVLRGCIVSRALCFGASWLPSAVPPPCQVHGLSLDSPYVMPWTARTLLLSLTRAGGIRRCECADVTVAELRDMFPDQNGHLGNFEAHALVEEVLSLAALLRAAAARQPAAASQHTGAGRPWGQPAASS